MAQSGIASVPKGGCSVWQSKHPTAVLWRPPFRSTLAGSVLWHFIQSVFWRLATSCAMETALNVVKIAADKKKEFIIFINDAVLFFIPRHTFLNWDRFFVHRSQNWIFIQSWRKLYFKNVSITAKVKRINIFIKQSSLYDFWMSEIIPHTHVE